MRVPTSPGFIACLVVLLVAAGCATVLLTGQSHHAEAKIVCERFVKRRLPPGDARFSGVHVRDLSETRHVVTLRVRVAGGPPRAYACTVSHTGTTWALDGLRPLAP